MDNKWKFNIDKLEITYTCPQELRELLSGQDRFVCGENDDVVLVRAENKNYHHTFQVYCSEVHVGELLFDTPKKNRQHIYLEVDNELLYTCVAGLSYIEQALNLTFYRISKLDICFDTNRNVINKFYRLIKDETQTIIINNKVIRDRKATIDEILHFSKGSLDNIRKEKSFRIEGNEIEMEAYDKRAEIEDSGKEYIKENLQMFKRVYRIEVRLPNAKQIQKALGMCGVNMEELYYYPWGDVLQTIFIKNLNRIIRLKNNECVLNYLLKKD